MTKLRRPSRSLSRRNTLKLAAASAALPLVHIRTAGAAGKLSMVFWDHWVPAGNDAMRKLIQEWSDKNKVEVQADFLTANGGKINLTMAAEAQARTGHDAYAFDMWTVHQFADHLIPLDDVMKSLIAANGPVAHAFEHLGTVKGHWMAVPTGSGSAPLTSCARISMLKQYAGIDVQALYPAHEVKPPEAADWTYDTFLKAAEACHKAGYPFALGCGTTTDSVQTWGAIFGAMGADLVDAKGNITADTPAVRAALEYAQKLVAFLPPETVSYDDASNNRALISGKSALIFNPPSAWAVAKRDAPAVAADCWTFPNPKGPKGRMVPMRPYLLGGLGVRPEQVGGQGPDPFPGRPQAAGSPLHGGDRLRHSRLRNRCRTSRSGARSSRPKVPSTTILSAPGTRRNTISPAPRARMTSRCRCSAAARSRRWWRSWFPASRPTRRSPG